MIEYTGANPVRCRCARKRFCVFRRRDLELITAEDARLLISIRGQSGPAASRRNPKSTSWSRVWRNFPDVAIMSDESTIT